MQGKRVVKIDSGDVVGDTPMQVALAQERNNCHIIEALLGVYLNVNIPSEFGEISIQYIDTDIIDDRHCTQNELSARALIRATEVGPYV